VMHQITLTHHVHIMFDALLCSHHAWCFIMFTSCLMLYYVSSMTMLAWHPLLLHNAYSQRQTSMDNISLLAKVGERLPWHSLLLHYAFSQRQTSMDNISPSAKVGEK
jgi:hypothetical protein